MAQQADRLANMLPNLTQVAITLLGVVWAAKLAFDAFSRRSVLVADVPTFPRYMTSRTQYRLGSSIFVIFACGVFLLLVYEHRQVIAAASLVDGMIPNDLIKAVSDQTAPYLIVIAAMGAVYLYFLTKEVQWNALLIVRDVIYRWISIPQLAGQIVAQLRFSLHVPPDAVAAVVAGSAGVMEQDFRKDSNTPDRLWAETCYMKWWLTQGHDAGEDATFFTEESFGFDRLLRELQQASRDMTRWKAGAAADLPVTELIEKIKDLHNRFSRLIACYFIYRNGSRKELCAEAGKFGVQIDSSVPQNPMRYWIVYAIVLIGAVYVGVYASAILFDLLRGEGLRIAQDFDRTVAWIAYSLSNYGLAIAAVLLLRSALGYVGSASNQSHLVTYCWTFLAAFVVGPLGLTIAVHLFGHPPYTTASIPQLYFGMLKWGLGPALVSVYMSYHLDRQIYEDLPSIDNSAATIGWRLAKCVVFVGATMFLLLPQLLSVTAGQGSVWDSDKLRFVATGTTFCLTFALALAAQFALTQSAPVAPAALSPRPS
jgi:hypothetical protein